MKEVRDSNSNEWMKGSLKLLNKKQVVCPLQFLCHNTKAKHFIGNKFHSVKINFARRVSGARLHCLTVAATRPIEGVAVVALVNDSSPDQVGNRSRGNNPFSSKSLQDHFTIVEHGITGCVDWATCTGIRQKNKHIRRRATREIEKRVDRVKCSCKNPS